MDWENYISDDRKAEIAEEVFRQELLSYLGTSRDVERVLGNLSYTVVEKIINAKLLEIGEKTMMEIIEPKVIEIINGLTSYSVFKKRDTYLREPISVGQELLDKAVADNAELIQSRVQELISQVDLDEIRDALWSEMVEYFKPRLESK